MQADEWGLMQSGVFFLLSLVGGCFLAFPFRCSEERWLVMRATVRRQNADLNGIMGGKKKKEKPLDSMHHSVSALAL